MVVEAADLSEGHGRTGTIVFRLTRSFEVGGEGHGVAAEACFDGSGDGGRAGAEGFRGKAALVREEFGEATLGGGDRDAA